jgi:hypothetical protein
VLTCWERSWVLGLGSQVSGLGSWTSKPRGFGHAAWEERGRRTGQLGTLARPCSSARKHVQATLFRRGVDMRRILFERATEPRSHGAKREGGASDGRMPCVP